MGNTSRKLSLLLLAVPLFLLCSGVARSQPGAGHGAGQNVAEMKFDSVPGIPACSTAAVLNGNPANGPSILLVKAETGCTVPWHWHTPNEHLMIVSGEVGLKMKDAKSLTLRAGGYALMPAKHVHLFHCASSCTFYVFSDGAFDTHYVDEHGQEIALSDAQKLAGQAAPK